MPFLADSEPNPANDTDGYSACRSGPDPRTDADAPERDGDLRQFQKMNVLGALAGGIAHDSNNILSAVLNAAEMAELLIAPEHPAHPLLEVILQATRRASQLNRQVLAFSRKDGEPHRCFDLGGLIKEATDLLALSFPRQVAIRTDIAAPTWVRGDPNQIHQVFLNLAINGQTAMLPGGGELRVSLGAVQLDGSVPALPAGSYAALDVRDSGCGMDATVMARIFTPFFTTKAARGGMGLGLAIARKIVQEHAGAILVESAPGQGTRFRVLLPIAAGYGEPSPPTGPFAQRPG